MTNKIGVVPERLRFEMARRGLSSTDLAKEAQVSVLTVRRATAGRFIRPASFKLIATALARIPILEGAEYLLIDGETGGNAGRTDQLSAGLQ